MKKKILVAAVLSSFFLAPNALAFTDTNNHDNEEAIDYLYEEGIVEGYDNGTYLPNNSINRAEFVKILMEAVYPNEAEGSSCFFDVGSEWYAPYVCEAKDRDIVDGYDDNTFRPATYINLAEALKIVLEAYGIDTCDSCYDLWYEPYYEKAQELDLLDDLTQNVSNQITRGEMAQLVYNTVLYLEDEADPAPEPEPTPEPDIRTYDEDDYSIYEVAGDEIPYHTAGTVEDYSVIAIERENIRVYVPEGYETLGMAHVEDLRNCEPLLADFLGIPFPKDEIILEIYIPTDGVSLSYSGQGEIHYGKSRATLDTWLSDVLEGNPDGFLYESSSTYCANTHELTHAFLYDVPLRSWSDEGIAEYSQSVNQGDVKDYISCGSTGYYSDDEWFDYVDLTDEDSGGSTFYHTAMCLIQLIVDEYGEDGFQSVMDSLHAYHTGEATITKSENYHFVNDVLIPILGTSVVQLLEDFGIEEADYAS